MSAVRAIRIRMPDRPGQLSTIGAALAAHAVDITRLDVVAHDGEHVVDDMVLSAETAGQIDAAVAGFMPEVQVRFFPQPFGDPAIEVARALDRAASQGSADGVRQSVVHSAATLGRAEEVAFLRVQPDGRVTVLAGPPALAEILPDEPFTGRRALAERCALGFSGASCWAPAGFTETLGSPRWVALAPCGPHDVIVCGRTSDIRFYGGELERLSGFGRAAGGIMALHGDRLDSGSVAGEVSDALPEEAYVLPVP
jgi:hypothetical protein